MKYILLCLILSSCAATEYQRLSDIQDATHARFTYTDPMPDKVPKIGSISDGSFSGNCNDFAVAIYQELQSQGYRGMLLRYCITERNQPHMITTLGDYAFDNRRKKITLFNSLGYRCE